MTEKPRTASEIRAYCEAATKEPWVMGVRYSAWGRLVYALRGVETGGEEEAGANCRFIENARTDLPRLLDAADESWSMVARLYHEGATADLHPDTVAEVERIIDEYGWLEDTNGSA